MLTWADLPSHCPSVLCDDELPKSPNQRLLALWTRHEDLVADVGATGPGVHFVKGLFCEALMQEKQRDMFLSIGRINEWPEHIDYTTLPSRILDLRPPILEMIQDAETLKNSQSWVDFLNHIDNDIFLFSRTKSKLDFTYALYGRRCG